MKSRVNFRLSWSIVILCLLNGCSIFGPEKEPDFDPVIKTGGGIITAQYLMDFGKIIETDADHVLVGSYEAIHIFKHSDPGIELIQTIGFEKTSGITGIAVHEGELIFGLAEAEGTGTVYVYSRNGDVWVRSQEIRKGRNKDNFGCAIDVDGESMVIGANSGWYGCTPQNECDGRVYVFRKSEGLWEETQEIRAESLEAGISFGSCVAIYGDLMLTSSSLVPLHIYQFNGTWELLRTEEVEAGVISHCGNNFLLGGDYEARAFLLESDGTLLENDLNVPDLQDIMWFGETVEIKDSLALMVMEPPHCYLLRYENRTWSVEKSFPSDPGEYCTFQGLALTDRHAIIGGMDYEDTQYAYVYFREL